MKKIYPFIIAGVLVVFAILGIVVLSYVLFWGLLVGVVMFGIAWLKNRFWPNKDTIQSSNHEHQGRIFDHSDL